MKLKNNELKKILAIAAGVINKASTIKEYSCIKISTFSANGNGMATFLTSNSQQTIIQSSNSVELKTDEKWEALVDFPLLNALVGKFSSEETEILRLEEKVLIRNGRSKTEIATMSGDIAIPELKNPQSIMEISKADWYKFFTPITYALAADDTRPILQCALLNNKGENTDLIALDGYRLAKTSIPLNKEVTCIIDGNMIKNVTDISKKFDDDTIIKFFKAESKLFFTINNCSIIGNVMVGKFIGYEKIIPDSDQMEKIEISKEDLEAALNRVKIGNDKNNLVKIEINENKLTLLTNSQIAKIKEELEIVSSMQNFCIAFNINYLLDGIKQFPEEKITMHFNNSVSPCVIQNDYMLSLVLPVRMLS